MGGVMYLCPVFPVMQSLNVEADGVKDRVNGVTDVPHNAINIISRFRSVSDERTGNGVENWWLVSFLWLLLPSGDVIVDERMKKRL